MNTLLIADADAALVDVLACLLDDAAYAVRTACDAPSAIATLRRGGIDAALCDAGLPGLAPSALWAAIHPLEVPLVLMSARSEWQVRAAMPGHYLFLAKPFTHYALTNAVLQALHHGGAARAHALAARHDATASSQTFPPGSR